MTDRIAVFASRPPTLEHKAREYAVELGGIKKSYGKREALKGISLRVAPGEVCSIIGASGSGKSTLLRCVNLSEEPDHGNMIVAGVYMQAGGDHSRKELQELHRRVGTVFGAAGLAPRKTVLDNIVVAQRRQIKRRAGEARDRAWQVLGQVGLFDIGGAFPGSLTPSQLRRVAIAKALALDPAVLLVDDPTRGIDADLVPGLIGVLEDVAASGMTMLVATPETELARRLSDHIVVLDEGAIVAQGSPTEILPPATRPKPTRRSAAVLAR